jgi:hypothetical protein
MTVRFSEQAARVRSSKLGPPVEATVRLGPGRDGAPFRIDLADVRIARVPIPDPIVSWVVTHFDPTPRLRDLPVAVSAAPAMLTPEGVEVGTPVR